MAKVTWVKLGLKTCDRAGEPVELMEKRVYPEGILDNGSEEYRVLMRKCSAGYQCGDMEQPCQWAEVGHDGRLYNR